MPNPSPSCRRRVRALEATSRAGRAVHEAVGSRESALHRSRHRLRASGGHGGLPLRPPRSQPASLAKAPGRQGPGTTSRSLATVTKIAVRSPPYPFTNKERIHPASLPASFAAQGVRHARNQCSACFGIGVRSHRNTERDDTPQRPGILVAASDAVAFAEAASPDEVERDRRTQLSTLKLVMIVGLAAAHVSEATGAVHAAVPWPGRRSSARAIASAHACFDMDLPGVRDPACDDVTVLLARWDPTEAGQ